MIGGPSTSRVFSRRLCRFSVPLLAKILPALGRSVSRRRQRAQQLVEVCFRPYQSCQSSADHTPKPRRLCDAALPLWCLIRGWAGVMALPYTGSWSRRDACARPLDVDAVQAMMRKNRGWASRTILLLLLARRDSNKSPVDFSPDFFIAHSRNQISSSMRVSLRQASA